MLEDVTTYTSKRSCLRTPFADERVNKFQTLLKSARHHYYPLSSSIRGKLSWETFALVWYEILRLFFNAWTAGDNYSERNMQSLRQKVSNAIISETKDFFLIFYCISEMCLKFGAFSKIQWEC